MDRRTGVRSRCTLLHGARPVRHADHETRVHLATRAQRIAGQYITEDYFAVKTQNLSIRREGGGHALLEKVENSKIDGSTAPLDGRVSQGKTRRYSLKINGAECREKTTKKSAECLGGGR
ncbi:hypothetical protein X777_13134 [Ooceraea biroi]|uniref:Uncharacterized protein n=1 Tax=Ooceraea biroi TaxID=2015173 RepID=A0A026WY12_OOCBI|nr:hypothetical protein X777_13134 [Ooceraea biroi]